ncbi:MAG: 50S ribosomal protein L29 [Alphaproteobacteria bacterium]|nr:50S ribosomal protein L29 [Alphaproteobacteria bacterium]
MKISEIRQKTGTELQDELVTLRREQMNLRFRQVAGQLTNTGRMRIVKRDIAKIKTAMTEHRLKGK